MGGPRDQMNVMDLSADPGRNSNKHQHCYSCSNSIPALGERRDKSMVVGIVRICKCKYTDGEQLCTLFQHFLGFVDLGGQIRTAASIWVVQNDELPVLLAYHLAGQASVSVR